MSTSSRFDVNSNIRGVIEWQSDSTTRVLAKPDPKVSSITLTVHFDSKSTHFQVRIPLKLKGLDTTSDITLRACASSIVSLDLVKNPTVLPEVEQEFKSTALGLRFKLNCNLDIIVPKPAVEPICPGSRRSGLVLDDVRDFSQATEFSIYIEARTVPAELQSIRDAVSQGLFKSSRSSRFQLASMYGSGAKIVQLAADDRSILPSYEELEPPPPPPLGDHKPDRKRRRKDTKTERADDVALIWAELKILQEERSKDKERITALEKKNQQLQKDMEAVQKKSKILEDLQYSFGALETVTEEKIDGLRESVSNELSDLCDDIKSLDGQLKFIEEGRINDESAAKIKRDVLQFITTQLSPD